MSPDPNFVNMCVYFKQHMASTNTDTVSTYSCIYEYPKKKTPRIRSRLGFMRFMGVMFQNRIISQQVPIITD